MSDDPKPISMVPIWGEGSLDDPGEYCCEFMRHQLDGRCRGPKGHTTRTVQCPDQVICYNAKNNSYTINPLGPSPCYSINYCPSCGTKL